MPSTNASDLIGRAPGRRKLIAVAHIDMVGYSRLIGLDDAGTLSRLRRLRRDLIDPAVSAHGGSIYQTAGDSFLIVFDSIDGAVRCALRVQREVPTYDGDEALDRRILFRIGINIGDVIAEGADLHGDGVNVAVRLQTACPPGSICVSRSVRDHVNDRLNLAFEELGRLNLKNIGRPVEAFVLRLDHDEPGDVRPAVRVPGLSIADAPRLSFVVLPFDNLSGDPNEDYIADAITEDLTTDLSRWPEAIVIARNSAAASKAKSLDVRRIGQELAVRYVIEGSVRKLGEVLRVNVQLISAETNRHLWAMRFDQDIKDLGNGQEEIVARLKTGLGIQLLETEIARGARERPANPDALDFSLRARSAYYQPYSTELSKQTAELWERALGLDPSSTQAMCGIADSLIDRYTIMDGPDRGNDDLIERADALISTAATIEPNNPRVIFSQGYLLRSQGRHTDAISTFQRLIERSPNFHAAYRHLGFSKIAIGQANEGIPLLRRSIRFDPLNSYNRVAAAWIGNSLLLLGDAAGAIEWQRRALAEGTTAGPAWRAQRHLFLSSAFAHLGQLESARHELVEANRLWPFATVRHVPPAMPPRGLPDPTFTSQMRVVQEGLRLTGLRDHADEDADGEIASANTLKSNLIGLTPATAPGATTITTDELAGLLEKEQVVLIDVGLDSLGWSIPGAIGLQGSGHGDPFSDRRQDRLQRKIGDLTKGDLLAPTVVFCVNSERFTGYNLALRLAALGYKQVFWYRGGFEAWQVNGLPESPLQLQDW